MYRKRFGASIGLLALLALTGCATTQVRRDYDEDISFAGLKTYTVLEPAENSGGSPALDSPLLARRIRAAVERELNRKGFEAVTSGEADFKVVYHVVGEKKLDVATFNNYSYYNYGYRSHYNYNYNYGHLQFGHPFYFGYLGPGLVTRSNVREYLEGTLILDIVDVRKNELIWRGWATKALARDPRPEKVDEYTSMAVATLLEEFPPTD